jgi:hypothetical protein
VPSTEDYFNELGGHKKDPETGFSPILSAAVDKTVYHSVLNDARNVVIETIESETGIKRLSTPTGKTGRDGQPVIKYTEKPQEYINRVLAQLTEQNNGTEVTIQYFAPALAKFMADGAEEVCFRVEALRQPRKSEVPQVFRNHAQLVLDDETRLAKFCVKAGALNPAGNPWSADEIASKLNQWHIEKLQREAALLDSLTD